MRDCYLITSNIKPLVALTTLKATLGLVLNLGPRLALVQLFVQNLTSTEAPQGFCMCTQLQFK